MKISNLTALGIGSNLTCLIVGNIVSNPLLLLLGSVGLALGVMNLIHDQRP